MLIQITKWRKMMFSDPIDWNVELLKATKAGDVVRVTECLQNGADIKATDDQGRTALHCAAEENIIELLLQNGADINAVDNHHIKAWHHAAVTKGRGNILAFLLQKGADINLSDDEHRRTVFHYAVNRGYTGSVAFLLQRGVDINSKDSIGWTALYNAVFNQNKDVVELLLQKGADFSVRINNGVSPEMVMVLHLSACIGNRAITILLLQYNAGLLTLNNEQKQKIVACLGNPQLNKLDINSIEIFYLHPNRKDVFITTYQELESLSWKEKLVLVNKWSPGASQYDSMPVKIKQITKEVLYERRSIRQAGEYFSTFEFLSTILADFKSDKTNTYTEERTQLNKRIEAYLPFFKSYSLLSNELKLKVCAKITNAPRIPSNQELATLPRLQFEEDGRKDRLETKNK